MRLHTHPSLQRFTLSVSSLFTSAYPWNRPAECEVDQIITSFFVVVISIIIIFPFFGLLSFYNKWISPEINTVLSYYNTIINLLLSQWCYWERWMCLTSLNLLLLFRFNHLTSSVSFSLSFCLVPSLSRCRSFAPSLQHSRSASCSWCSWVSLTCAPPGRTWLWTPTALH